MTEFAPLEYYFAEGKRQWPQTPKLVNSRAFYELWEKVYRPEPFPVGKPFRVAGTVLHLPSAIETLCGHTAWSGSPLRGPDSGRGHLEQNLFAPVSRW